MNSADAAVDIRGRLKCTPGSAAAATCLSVWHSVPETGFYGTEEIFGAKNRLLGYAAHFQRRAVPKAAPAAPDASSVRETAHARR